jgi:Tfp pilus assembly pilus retraction ATPase PilT
MNETDVRFLETALERQWITRRQRDKLLAEGDVTGEMSVADHLVKLGYLTQEQAAELTEMLCGGGNATATESSQRDVAASLSSVGPDGSSLPAQSPASTISPYPAKTIIELSRGAGLPLLQTQSRLNRVLSEVRARGADDFYWSADGSSSIQFQGNPLPWDGSALTPSDLETELTQLLSPARRQLLDDGKFVTITACLSEGFLARLTLLVTPDGLSMAARLHNAAPPPLDMLGLPPSLRMLLGFSGGLILIAGPKNSGRTTTVHALASELLRTRKLHCLRILRSLDYFLPPGCGMVTTWRVGREISTLLEGIQQSHLAAPDVLLIDELITGQECLAALDVAENNRLLLAVVAAETAQQSYSRFVEATHTDAIASVAVRFSEQLRGLLAQRLLPRSDTPGRIAVAEYLIGNPQSATTLRSGRPSQIAGAILTGKRIGMIALDDALMDLTQRGILARETAAQWLTAKQLLDKLQPRSDSVSPASSVGPAAPLPSSTTAHSS